MPDALEPGSPAFLTLAVALGALLAVLTLRVARRLGLEPWVTMAGLGVLPLLYVGFALAAGESGEALRELLLGVPWFVVAAAALARRSRSMTRLVGSMWLAHGVFDVVHDLTSDGVGVPGWYPALCLGFDLVLGAWLLCGVARHEPVDA